MTSETNNAGSRKKQRGARQLDDQQKEAQQKRLSTFVEALKKLDARKGYGYAVFGSANHPGHYVQFVSRRSWQSPVCEVAESGPNVEPLDEQVLHLLAEQGFSTEGFPQLEIDYDDVQSLAELADWLFSDVLACGDNYDLKVVGVDPGKADPPDAWAEAARQHRRFLFWQALQRVARDGAKDLAFVVFEDVNCPEKFVQLLYYEDGDAAECEVGRRDLKTSRTVLDDRALTLLTERGFTVERGGNPRLSVEFDDVWALVDLVEWAFVEALGCGDIYEADMYNASWSPQPKY